MIVLHEFFANAYFRKNPLVITFEKKPALVFEDPRLKYQCVRKWPFQNFHRGVMVRIRVLSASAEGRRRSGCSSWKRLRFRPARLKCIRNGKQFLPGTRPSGLAGFQSSE